MCTVPLELESPAFTCGHCRFSSAVAGKWSVEERRLVFRADADPQPRRGPDLEGCGESYATAEFTKIITDTGQEIELDELRKTARGAWDLPWYAFSRD